mmetsp:Transcript_1191/g.3938  ORF Transcript_1191/g.3938 Transcript_1191/m.3938 type:complete len:208 (+) Transcript_1191:358-981(+)
MGPTRDTTVSPRVWRLPGGILSATSLSVWYAYPSSTEAMFSPAILAPPAPHAEVSTEKSESTGRAPELKTSAASELARGYGTAAMYASTGHDPRLWNRRCGRPGPVLSTLTTALRPAARGWGPETNPCAAVENISSAPLKRKTTGASGGAECRSSTRAASSSAPTHCAQSDAPGESRTESTWALSSRPPPGGAPALRTRIATLGAST